MKIHKILSVGFAIFTAIFIFYVSSLTFGQGAGGFSWTSVIYHFAVFFALGFFVYVSFNLDRRWFVFVLLLCLLYAGLDEIHQLFVIGRTCALEDFFIDSFGILSSVIFVEFFMIFKR